MNLLFVCCVLCGVLAGCWVCGYRLGCWAASGIGRTREYLIEGVWFLTGLDTGYVGHKRLEIVFNFRTNICVDFVFPSTRMVCAKCFGRNTCCTFASS